MHLRPNATQIETHGFRLGELPRGKTAKQVTADFMRYLLDETATYITRSHSDGEEVWSQVKDKATFVLGHPNGWTGLPQQRYRQCAIMAGFVPDTQEGRERIKFVTEGEASALTCLSCKLGPAKLEVECPRYCFRCVAYTRCRRDSSSWFLMPAEERWTSAATR